MPHQQLALLEACWAKMLIECAEGSRRVCVLEGCCHAPFKALARERQRLEEAGDHGRGRVAGVACGHVFF